MGAQGLRCLTRYPSALPGLALAKTRTHHRDGTGCWGREMSKVGLRKRRGKGRRQERKRREREKGRRGQGQGRDGGDIRELRGKERGSKEKGRELQGKEAFRKTRDIREEDTLTQPFPSAAPPLWSKVEMGNKSLLQ